MKPINKGNANIQNYFKPKTTVTATEQTQTQTQPPLQSSSPDNAIVTPQSSVPSSVSRTEVQTNSSALKNGKVVVRNSDSEDSDSSGLDDIDIVLGNKPAATKASAIPPIKTPIKTRRSNFKPDASPMAVRPAMRNDMASLAKQAAKDRKAEAEREELMAILNDDNPSISSDEDFDEEAFLESIIPDEDGEGNAGKVIRAIKRQRVGRSNGLWLFFDFDTLEEGFKRSKLPQKSLSKCQWKSALTSAPTFRQTLLSGFADDMVAMGEELPEELLIWMLDDMCYEKKESIRHAYRRIITSHPAHIISELMVPSLIQRLFQNIGGSEEATNTEKVIGPLLKPVNQYQARSWDQVMSLVSLLGSLSTSLSLESQVYSICLLARLCMDYIVMEKLSLFRAVQAAFKSLITSIPEALWANESNSIKQTIFAFTELSTLQLQIIRCIPDEGNPRLHNFRRQLSLSVFLDSPAPLTQPLSATLSLPALITRFQSPPLQITHSTDYLSLSAYINLLDIALADGLYPGLNPSLDLITETKFNEDVDSIVRRLDLLESGLGQANAAQETRLHAKNVLTLVAKRIAGTVRTKEREREDIWGEKTKWKDLRPDNADMMLRFVRKMGMEMGQGA